MLLGSIPKPNHYSLSTLAVTAAYMPIRKELTELAEGLGASDFSLFSIGRGNLPKLNLLLDCAYPDIASLTQHLIPSMPREIISQSTKSTIVSWWASPMKAWSAGFERLHWAQRIPELGHSRAGLILPLYAGSAEEGMLVLTGSELLIDDDLLWEAHAQAMVLFERFLTVSTGVSTNVKLSKRELECLRLTADGHTSEEIAGTLGLSIHTANQYLANAGQKLNAVNRMHSVAKALRLGLID